MASPKTGEGFLKGAKERRGSDGTGRTSSLCVCFGFLCGNGFCKGQLAGVTGATGADFLLTFSKSVFIECVHTGAELNDWIVLEISRNPHEVQTVVPISDWLTPRRPGTVRSNGNTAPINIIPFPAEMTKLLGLAHNSPVGLVERPFDSRALVFATNNKYMYFPVMITFSCSCTVSVSVIIFRTTAGGKKLGREGVGGYGRCRGNGEASGEIPFQVQSLRQTETGDQQNPEILHFSCQLYFLGK